MASTVHIRRFRWRDLEEFTRIFNLVNGIAGSEKACDAELMNQLLSQPSCQPEENCFLAESGANLVGFTLISPELPIGRAVASGGVLESHRNQGIGRRLLRTTESRVRALKAAVIHVEALYHAADARHILEAEGFRPVRTYWKMRWDGNEAPPMELPAGFSLRPFVLGRDEKALTELQNAAFRENWGFCPNTIEDIAARVRLKSNDEGAIIFIAGCAGLAGYNWTMRAAGATDSIGWIHMTGVHPDYRGRGLGRTVVVSGMKHLRDKGVGAIELEVDADNAPARDLYLELGFKRFLETVWYEKALS